MKRIASLLLGIAAAAAAPVGPALGAEATNAAVPAVRGPAGAPVPEAWDYVRLTPDQRYDLRRRARALPEQERTQHNRALKTEIDKLPDWIHEALHDERNAMDCRHGTVSPLPAPPRLDAWAYAKRVPTDRYEFRLRANALNAEDRKAYETHLATELAKLPAWLQSTLAEEAERLDKRYGLKQCPGT